MERNLKDRKKALNAYVNHRRNVEQRINGASDVFVKLSFFVRNRVTDGFETWRDMVNFRINGARNKSNRVKFSG